MKTQIDVGTLQLETHQGLAGLEAIASEWRALAGLCARPTFCHYPEWYECYLRCLAPNPDDVFFCLLRREGRAIAVAPLERRCTHTAGIARHSLLLPQDAIHMPMADFTIVRSENMTEVTHAILTGCARLPDLRWDCLHLARVPESSCCAAASQALRDYPCVQRPLGFGDRVALAPFEQMQQSLSKSSRKHLALSRNRLARAGNVRFRTVSDAASLESAMDELIEVESSGWKGRQGTAIKCHPRLCAYYRMLAARFGAHGQCDIHTLYVNDRPAAVELALRSEDLIAFLKCGYDETFAALSPGNSLDAYAMQYYFENTPVRVVDMLSGYAYLNMWNPTQQAVFSLSVFNRSWSGFLASRATHSWYAWQTFHGRTTRRAMRMLQRLGIKN